MIKKEVSIFERSFGNSSWGVLPRSHDVLLGCWAFGGNVASTGRAVVFGTVPARAYLGGF